MRLMGMPVRAVGGPGAAGRLLYSVNATMAHGISVSRDDCCSKVLRMLAGEMYSARECVNWALLKGESVSGSVSVDGV